tara:strand:+ start:270 stop:611 length:342 start_codon:yes stop_codon:yes gene_type:complete
MAHPVLLPTCRTIYAGCLLAILAVLAPSAFFTFIRTFGTVVSFPTFKAYIAENPSGNLRSKTPTSRTIYAGCLPFLVLVLARLAIPAEWHPFLVLVHAHSAVFATASIFVLAH